MADSKKASPDQICLPECFPLFCASQLFWDVLVKEGRPRLLVRRSLAEVEVFEEGARIDSVYALHHIGLEVEFWSSTSVECFSFSL